MTPRCDTRFAHIPALMFLCSTAFCLRRLVQLLQHHCFHARHALGNAYCLPHACATLRDTIFHPFHTARSCLVLLVCWLPPSSQSPIAPKSHVSLRISFAWGLFWICFCLRGLVLDFVFSNFLFFWRDLCVILVLCIFVCCSSFCKFLDCLHFSRISRSGRF